MRLVSFIVLAISLAACKRDTVEEVPVQVDPLFALELPPGFPAPETPAANPLTDASVRLGKALFFDRRLSRTGTLSCASCHLPERAFSDTVSKSVGVNGTMGMRNSPSLGNVAYHHSFFRDGGVPTLEQQVLAPIHDPLEMDHDITVVAEALRDLEPYRSLSMKAYSRPLDAFVITRAIASYERTLISGWSRYDRYVNGDVSALTAAELNGLQLFLGTELNCTGCHSGFDLSDHELHNVGQYMNYADSGQARITLRHQDNGKFKTPSLRNVALTAPYMHDGAMESLEQVVDHFASGGLPHPNRDPQMQSFVLSAQQRSDLIAFLGALTDERTLDQLP